MIDLTLFVEFFFFALGGVSLFATRFYTLQYSQQSSESYTVRDAGFEPGTTASVDSRSDSTCTMIILVFD